MRAVVEEGVNGKTGPVTAMEWHPEVHYVLLALHNAALLVLWDTKTGAKVRS
jgi:hypothetical protein